MGTTRCPLLLSIRPSRDDAADILRGLHLLCERTCDARRRNCVGNCHDNECVSRRGFHIIIALKSHHSASQDTYLPYALPKDRGRRPNPRRTSHDRSIRTRGNGRAGPAWARPASRPRPRVSASALSTAQINESRKRRLVRKHRGGSQRSQPKDGRGT